jgi:leader peptidase (prepilin peptidase)/N-methyltransferase
MLEAVLAVVVGPMMGSLVGVLVDRLPEDRPVALARSQCASCGRTLGPLELVPLVSYVAQRGRCKGCGAAIPRRLPLIELAAMLIAIVAVWRADGIGAWAGAGLGWTLLCLGLIDWRHLWLPDVLTLPLTAAGLAVIAWLAPTLLSDHIIAAAAGWLVFTAIAWAYRRLRGREGLGGGDAKLLAAGGAWLGTAALPHVVLFAALAALIWAVVTRQLDPAGRLPFGSFLAGAIWLLWLATV